MSNLSQIDEEKSTHLPDIISVAIIELHTTSKNIINEFIEDGLVSGFKDIDKLTWYNFISSLCVIVRRFDEIKNSDVQEKLKDIVIKLNEETKKEET